MEYTYVCTYIHTSLHTLKTLKTWYLHFCLCAGFLLLKTTAAWRLISLQPQNYLQNFRISTSLLYMGQFTYIKEPSKVN